MMGLFCFVFKLLENNCVCVCVQTYETCFSAEGSVHGANADKGPSSAAIRCAQ